MFICVASNGGERETQMMQSAYSSSLTPVVKEEGILEQVLNTCRRHKTRVGHTLLQRIHGGTPSSSSCSEGTSVRVDRTSKNICVDPMSRTSKCTRAIGWCSNCWPSYIRTYSSPTISSPKPYYPLGPLSPLDVGNDKASDAANLRDS